MSIIYSSVVVNGFPEVFSDFLIALQDSSSNQNIDEDLEDEVEKLTKKCTKTIDHPLFKMKDWDELFTCQSAGYPEWCHLIYLPHGEADDEFNLDFCGQYLVDSVEYSAKMVELYYDFISQYSKEIFLGYSLDGESIDEAHFYRNKHYNTRKYPQLQELIDSIA